VESAPYRRDALWRPDGPGFHRVVVVDADGRSEALDVRVKREDSGRKGMAVITEAVETNRTSVSGR